MKKFTKTAVFAITYRCNNNCDFCLTRQMTSEKSDLSLEEIKNNFFYLKDKYSISRIIITGGEPTIHPDFWKIMDFFYNEIIDVRPSLNTNAILFNQKEFAQKFDKFLSSAKNKQKTISLSLSDVSESDFDAKNLKKNKKINGVKKAIQIARSNNTKLNIIITITKSNFKILPQIAQFIVRTKKTSEQSEKRFNVQLRGLYVKSSMSAKMSEEQKDNNLPRNFLQVFPYLEKTIAILLKEGNIRLALFNLPLCYFSNSKIFLELRKSLVGPIHEKRFLVNHMKKLSGVKPYKFMKEDAPLSACLKCGAKSHCNKIQLEYLEKFNYPKPISIDEEM